MLYYYHMKYNFRKKAAMPGPSDIDTYINEISKEFRDAFDVLKSHPRTVTIFGSARFAADNEFSLKAERIAKRITGELQYGVITGGGPGIMEAANHGAEEGSGDSLGFTITLPREQMTNPYVNESLNFKYFFSRKAMLAFSAEAYVFFPGGFGTFDELFTITTLIQTHKVPKVPVILVGVSYWTPIMDFIKEYMYEKHHVISKSDLELFTITDDEDEVIKIIKDAPVSEWWNVMD